MFDIVETQIVIIALPYGDVIMSIAWISITYIVMVSEMISRACVEIPVSVVIPGLPCIVFVVSGHHADAGQI
jgi:hypothetical protein